MPSTHRLVALVLLPVLLIGCDTPEPSAPPPAEVAVVTLHSEDVTLTSELPGRVVAAETSEVRPQVGGVIRERLFEEGALVEAGDVLYQIEDAPYRAALGIARGNLARAEAAIDATRHQAERYEALGTTSAISRQAIDDARAAAAQAEAETRAQRAAVEAAEINLDFTRIKAPISGRIGRSLVTPGALVEAEQGQPLATIQQTSVVHVDITQSASQVLDLRAAVQAGELFRDDGSTPVELLLPNGQRYPGEGRLRFSEVTVNPATGAVTLRATFDNPDGLLLPGMHVRARLIEGVRRQVILAPQRGIQRDNRGRAVALVVDDSDRVVRRAVTAERAVGDHWLVTDGLDSGDRLIVEGFHRAAPEATVAPVPWTVPSASTDSSQAEPLGE